MDNLFDGLQVAAHTVVGNTMGNIATWMPSTGGATQTAKVLFKTPTQKGVITDQDYDGISPKIEFLQGDFVGLVDAVRSNKTEMIVISGVSYLAYKVDQKFDGKTVIIHIEPA
jgi:hypothetical protein